MYIRINKHSKVIIALYIDDGLIIATDRNLINDTLKQIQDTFEITIGNSEYFLGMEIKRNCEESSIIINQTLYIKRILMTYNMTDAKFLSIPADPSVKLQSATIKKESRPTMPYREAVGALLFLSLVSRILLMP